MNSAMTMTVKKIPSDTLCGFNYFFSTHKECNSAKEVIEKYKVVGFPTFFIIDPMGKLIYVQRGYSESVETEIIELLKERMI